MINELLNFEKKQRKLRLSKVSKKIGLSGKEIINYLESNGFDDLNSPIVYLYDKHIDVLSKAYVKSIKSFYNSVSKRYSNLSPKKQKELKSFFSMFARKGFSFLNIYRYETALEKALEGRLNNTLILNHFYDLILEVEYESSFGNSFLSIRSVEVVESPLCYNEYEKIFNKYKHFIKLKIPIRNSFNDIRSELQSILIYNHYYIFSDDEDNNGEVNYRTRFSRFIDKQREALKIIYYLKLQDTWTKTLKYS